MNDKKQVRLSNDDKYDVYIRLNDGNSCHPQMGQNMFVFTKRFVKKEKFTSYNLVKMLLKYICDGKR